MARGSSLAALASAALLSCGAARAPGLRVGGADLCVLFEADNVRGRFHFGRVDFAGQQLIDLAALPPELEQANGGVAAGADEGVFYVPAQPYSNNLYELSLKKNKTTLTTIAPPPGYNGASFAFETMQLNDATGDLWALLNHWPDFVGVISVFPHNSSSAALTTSFAPQFGKFGWHKVGVAAVDSKRGLFYFVAGVGAADTPTLVGVAVDDPAAPVSLVEIPGPTGNSSDIDFLGYSAALDLFVVSCSLITTGISSVQVLPADGKGDWTVIYEWPAGAEGDNELGECARPPRRRGRRRRSAPIRVSTRCASHSPFRTRRQRRAVARRPHVFRRAQYGRGHGRDVLCV